MEISNEIRADICGQTDGRT